MPAAVSDEETGWARYKLPLLFGGGLALYGASRFDGTRPIAGVLLTYGFPLVALLVGRAPFRESSLAGAALVVGGLGALSAEIAIGHALQPNVAAFGMVPPLVLGVASVLALIGAAAVQAAASGRGMRNTFAAWMGIVTLL